MQKKKIVTVLIVIATVVLAGIAVFTAYRLYELRQESVAPTAPESKPEAVAPQTTSCTQLAFVLGTSEPSASPSDSPTASPSDSPTASPSDSPTTTPTTPPAGTSTPAAGTGTAAPSLPEAGVSYPTLVSAGLGILIILGSLVLIF